MRSLRSLPGREAGFVEPMECLAVTKLPDGPGWVYEIKLDGYRALAINANGKLSLYSRRRKSLNRQYRQVFDALRDLPENTVVDGEVVALDDAGRPNFSLLQHSRRQANRICYFVFYLLVYQNRDLTHLPLIERREILRSVLKFHSPRIRIAEYFEASAAAMLESTAEQGLEGVVAKRKDSRYEVGKRSGAWAKHRINNGQELVIVSSSPNRLWPLIQEEWTAKLVQVRNQVPDSTRTCSLGTIGSKQIAMYGLGHWPGDHSRCIGRRHFHLCKD
jgi:bifunctional non-homologous end joining protein LigD